MHATPFAEPVALVAEDDEHIGQLLKFLLERENYRVHLVPDGRAAMAFIAAQPAPAAAGSSRPMLWNT